MLRIVGGLVAGIGVFMITLLLVEYVGHQLSASPSSTRLLVAVTIAYFASTFLGGLVAGRIAQRRWAAWAIALLAAAGIGYTLATMPHPLWMQIASIAAPLLGGLFASHLVPVRPAARADAGV